MTAESVIHAVVDATGGPRRLRVAQVVTRMDIGGVPDHVMTLVRGLCRDCDVVVLCASIDPRHARELKALSVPVIEVAFARLPSPLTDAKAFLRMLRILRERPFDVVHTHMSKAALIGALAARLSGVSVVINTAHNLGFLALRNPALRALFWVYDRVLFALACDLIVTVSRQVRDQVVRAGIAPARKVAAIPNGIDPARFHVPDAVRQATRSALADSDSPVIVTVARLVWFKGLDTLVAAGPDILARYPRARILVVGEGPLRDALSAQSARLGLDGRVIFLGERTDVAAVLAAADIFVLPSVSEGMPISILEAMAAGLPVVATRVGGVADLLDDGRTGILVPARDASALAEALLRVADTPAFAQAMGRAGRSRLVSDFSAEAMVTRTRALYEHAFHRQSERTEARP